MRKAEKTKKQTEPAPLVKTVTWKPGETLVIPIPTMEEPKPKPVTVDRRYMGRPLLCTRESSPLFGQPPTGDDLKGLLEHLENIQKTAEQLKAKVNYWKTGGHGHECSCDICRHSFAGWKMGRNTIQEGYDQFLTKYYHPGRI